MAPRRTPDDRSPSTLAVALLLIAVAAAAWLLGTARLERPLDGERPVATSDSR